MKINRENITGLYESPSCKSLGLLSEGTILSSSAEQTTGVEDYLVIDDSSNWY